MASIRFLLLSVLLLGVAAPAVAAADIEQTLQGLRRHGYVSVAAARSELQKVARADRLGTPRVRGDYHAALQRLAMDANEPDEVRRQMQSLARLAKEGGCASCLFEARLGAAYLAMKEDSVNAARPLLQQAEAVLPPGDAEARMHWLALRGNIEGQDHHLDRAIDFTMQSLALAEAQGDAAEAVRALGALVWMNADLEDYPRAIAQGEKALARAKAMNFRPMMARISLDLGHAYAMSGQRQRQRIAIERALALSRSDPALLNIRALSLNNLSDFYLSQGGQYARALAYAREAEALARAHGREIHRAAPLTNMGIAMARLGQVDEGIARIREALAIARKLQVQEYVVGITQELVKVLEAAGRYREALARMRSVRTLESELTRQQREKAVLDLQEKYAAERRNREIAQLSAQNTLKQSQLQANAWRLRLWVVLALALALAAGVLLHAMRRIRQANRRLAEQSRIDPLTGAWNRRHALSVLGHLRAGQVERRAREVVTHGTGLMLLDLDFFKRINDSRGHAAGDAVLVETVRRLRGMLRRGDLVARWGGEEFVLALPGLPLDALASTARKVLHVIGESAMETLAQPVTVTVSVGAIHSRTVPADWEQLLALADLALYRAKADGRNRAICLEQVDKSVLPALATLELENARADGLLSWRALAGPGPSASTPRAIVGAELVVQP